MPVKHRLSKKYAYRVQARSYAVQAIYQHLMGRPAGQGQVSDAWLDGFLQTQMAQADQQTQQVFLNLCRGVMAQQAQLEQAVQPFMRPNKPFKSMVMILRSFFLLSAWEWLYGRSPTDASLQAAEFIAAWLHIAHGFCHQGEVSFLNAFLQKLVDGKVGKQGQHDAG